MTDVIYAGGSYLVLKIKSYLANDLTFIVDSPSYGTDIDALTTDTEFIYAGGGAEFGTAGDVKKYSLSDLSFIAKSPSTDLLLRALVNDASAVYVGGYPYGQVVSHGYIKKYLKSNLSLAATSPNYGGGIYALIVDGVYVYAVGETTWRIRRYLASDLSYVAQSPLVGSNCLTFDDTHIYSGGSNNIWKCLKSDLSYIGTTPAYGGQVLAVANAGNYVYGGGATTQKIRKYLKSDLSYVTESPSYGATIRALVIAGNYIYAGGEVGVSKVKKYLLSDLSYVAESPSYGAGIFALAYGAVSFIIAPTVTTDPATAIGETAATLSGTLNGDGGEACQSGFEWGLTPAYGHVTPTQSKITGQTFSQIIGPLAPHTTYHFRAFATNSAGTSYGADRTFTTLGIAVPIVTTNPATIISSMVTTLNGILDDDGGEACQCGFEWGKSVAYGSATPTQSKNTGQTFSEIIAPLDPDTEYHFRAFAINSAGIGYGADRSFRTYPAMSRAYALSRSEL